MTAWKTILLYRDGLVTEEEREIEKSIRPKSFDDFNGQEKLVENLKVFVEAAKIRNESLDHVILSGPPGLGKDYACKYYFQ